MTSRLETIRLYRPMTPGGGAFLAVVGLSLLIGVWLPDAGGNQALLVGFALGTVALIIVSVIGRRRGLPKPATRDILIVWACAAAEILVLMLLTPHLDLDQRGMMLFVFMVVGVHFLPMAFSFGPLIAALGVSCFTVAAAGFFVPAFPLTVIAITDALLKLGFGLTMLAGLRPAQRRSA